MNAFVHVPTNSIIVDRILRSIASSIVCSTVIFRVPQLAPASSNRSRRPPALARAGCLGRTRDGARRHTLRVDPQPARRASEPPGPPGVAQDPAPESRADLSLGRLASSTRAEPAKNRQPGSRAPPRPCGGARRAESAAQARRALRPRPPRDRRNRQPGPRPAGPFSVAAGKGACKATPAAVRARRRSPPWLERVRCHEGGPRHAGAVRQEAWSPPAGRPAHRPGPPGPDAGGGTSAPARLPRPRRGGSPSGGFGGTSPVNQRVPDEVGLSRRRCRGYSALRGRGWIALAARAGRQRRPGLPRPTPVNVARCDTLCRS